MPKKKTEFVEMEVDLNSFLTPSEIKDMEQMAKDANMELSDFIVHIIEGYVTQLGNMGACECVGCDCEEAKPEKKKAVKKVKKATKVKKGKK